MTDERRSRDDRLLDALEQIEGVPYAGPMWRVVRTGRDVLDGSRSAGRWNPASLSVLYGAQEPDGALAEIHFHLTRGQPVFPSRMQHELHELRVKTGDTLVFADLDALAMLGVEAKRYQEMVYFRTQEIADAAYFLGFDGIIAPSARWTCQNIVLFVSHPKIDLDEIESVRSTPIDWDEWRARHRSHGP
ncbi:MAG: RES family NAD+ phosphorylase [Pseudomonadota bacterium]